MTLFAGLKSANIIDGDAAEVDGREMRLVFVVYSGRQSLLYARDVGNLLSVPAHRFGPYHLPSRTIEPISRPSITLSR